MKISVKVKPCSSKNEVTKMPDKSLKIKLMSAPIGGEANDQLIKILSKHLGVAKNKIIIKTGLTGRNKIVEII